MNFAFDVPMQKKKRVIVNTDAKNEADDQFAIAHHLMTPQFMVKGIIGAHFEVKPDEGKAKSMAKSYDEINKVLSLMGLDGKYDVYKGAVRPMRDEKTPSMSEGAEFIIKEALSDDPSPLYVVFLGTLTDLASAYLTEPKIAGKLTAVWIGGGKWPTGGSEFNLMQDINAANVVFRSNIPFWQVPKNVYRMVRISLAELQCKVRPYGKIGKYLFDQMVEYNDQHAGNPRFPMGETWVLGDSPTVSVLIEDHEFDWDWRPAPQVTRDLFYVHNQNNRAIRVYNNIDARLTLEDFFCKLAINYPA